MEKVLAKRKLFSKERQSYYNAGIELCMKGLK
jgi:hypothetical protein